ncbi:MAG: tRNA (adenine(22)-N(1))-methyltransferase TrmK [Firmicutes bacterium]|nr:tRNA (adenine(22)-N(1))-methyltransferase TrmK [Bacillota bacterium]
MRGLLPHGQEWAGDVLIRRLEPRLELIRAWCQPYQVIADVGAHEGLLARWLALDGHTVWATELTPGGFRELCRGVAGSPVVVRQGNGLAPLLRVPVDVVILAGLGGQTIRAILRRHHEMLSRPVYIVQPVPDALSFHQVVVAEAWTILRADIVRYRGRYYPTWMLAMTPAGQRDDGIDAFIPQEFSQAQEYRGWLERECERRRIALRYHDNARLMDELRRLEDELARIEGN